MTYNRPWMSFADQLELLKSRNMQVTDETAALSYLERIGYYRLSAYWYPFRVFRYQQSSVNQSITIIREDNFQPDTQFLDAVNLYIFDKHLRLLVGDALERIEVALRVDMAYLLGSRDLFAHHDINQFHPKFASQLGSSGQPKFSDWQQKYTSLLGRSKEDFVKHYREKHGPNLPIWVAIEVWDFGLMSQLFSMMKVADQERIARKYGVQDWKVFQSWLRSLNYLRNLVAHHSRLWNRNVIDQPKLPQARAIPWCDSFIGKVDLQAKPFLLLAICRHMVKVVCPGTHWPERVKDHLNHFPDQYSSCKRSILDMGVMDTWQNWW
jgi:abortive infection bacteriophage resistance protein